MSKNMLISVGGAEAPIIWSIQHHKPEKIIFFTSPASRTQVSDKIMPAIFKEHGKMIDHEIIVTEDEQDIGECTRILFCEVPKALQKFGLEKSWADIIDYTGGTKTMSAAIVWASSKFPCEFSYIGADSKSSRGKGGLGIVIDGREKCLIQENPWNKLAYFEINDAIKLFNRGQYANSAELFADIAEKVTDKRAGRVLSVLCEVVQGYAQWDMFKHKNALRLIGENIKPLADMAEIERFFLPNLKSFSLAVAENFKLIEEINEQELSLSLIYDLLANALRRAELEKKFEDATARTYSAIEKTAKLQLKNEYGIDNSKCSPEQLPETLREQYTAKYKNSAGTTLSFGAMASFELLYELDDIYGMRFTGCKNIRNHLTERNYSILGHGMQAIDKSKFDDLFNDALNILDINLSDLYNFPRFTV